MDVAIRGTINVAHFVRGRCQCEEQTSESRDAACDDQWQDGSCEAGTRPIRAAFRTRVASLLARRNHVIETFTAVLGKDN